MNTRIKIPAWARIAFVPKSKSTAPQSSNSEAIPEQHSDPLEVGTVEERSVTARPKRSETVSGIGLTMPADVNYSHSNRSIDMAELKQKPKEFLFEPSSDAKPKHQKENPQKQRLWPLSNRQKYLALLAFGIIVIVCCVSILVPTLVLRQSTSPVSSSVMINRVSMCSRTTCMNNDTSFRSSSATLSYRFDGNLYESTGLYGATFFGLSPPIYYSPQGMANQAAFLNSFLNQYLTMPYVNLSQRSFTLQIWLIYYSDNVTLDYTVFFQCGLTDDLCIRLSIRENHIALSFDARNPNATTLLGSNVVPLFVWNHITVVYDAVALQQSIYLNGRIDAVSSGLVYPYQGTPAGGSITSIGLNSSILYSPSFFYGYIDQFIISNGIARTPCQVLNDATLLAYFPFNADRQLLDYSVFNNYGYASNVYTMSNGRIGQAILFNTTTSYFQSQCFPALRSSFTFTFALWVYPISGGNGGTLLHVSLLQNGTGPPCYDLLGLTEDGHLVMQVAPTITNATDFQGPILPVNTWTHVAVLYRHENGMRLYVNGQLVAMTRSHTPMVVYTYYINFVTLGNNNPNGPAFALNCPLGSLTNYTGGPFYGAIDDFRYYSRELDAQELCVLANM